MSYGSIPDPHERTCVNGCYDAYGNRARVQAPSLVLCVMCLRNLDIKIRSICSPKP